MKNFIKSFTFFLYLMFYAIHSFAEDMDDARSIAINILKSLEQKRTSEVWESQVSSWFKGNMTRDAFLANSTFMQAQLGGASSARKLVQQNRSDGDPRVSYKGDIFSFVFSATYPASKVYENIVLIRDGGTYKLSGLYFLPNPN